MISGWGMFLSEFDYELPEELIAQRPSDKRENSRMMVLNRDEHKILNKHFYDIVGLLDENHVLILNDTILRVCAGGAMRNWFTMWKSPI